MAGHGEKSGGGVWRVVFWIALLACLCSVAALGYIAYSYWSADKSYDAIAASAFAVDDVANADDAVAGGTTLASMTVDWDYLRSINSDVLAWVYMPGTAINYPVVQADDNDTYLTMDFNQRNGFSARCGSIFLDCANKADFSDANNVLYGHHMNDGSMFACISKQLTDSAEFNAHRTIYVLTPDMNYECQTFSLVITDGYDPLVKTGFEDDAAMAAYVQDKEDRSSVQPEEGMPDAAGIEKLFTFSTCDYQKSDGRAVLFSQVVDSAVPGSTGESAPISEGDVSAMEDAQAAA